MPVREGIRVQVLMLRRAILATFVCARSCPGRSCNVCRCRHRLGACLQYITSIGGWMFLKSLPHPPGPRPFAPCMQVETLAGSVLTVEVDAGASLDAMRAGIAREVGIMAKQQRLIILGTRTP